MNRNRDTHRYLPPWLLLMGAVCALTPLSVDMYLPAFSAISQEFGTRRGEMELTLALFLAGLALGQLIYGPLSDRYGRKPPLYAGLVLYILATAGCALATDISQLLLWRFLAAVGGSAGFVISFAVVRDRSGDQDTARGLSALVLARGLAPILGPVIGGALLLVTSWLGIFWLLALAGAICLLATMRWMRETVRTQDVVRATPGHVVRVYLSLFRHRQYLRYTLCYGLATSGMFAYIAGSPHVLIDLYGLTPQQYSWAFGLNAAGMIATAQFNSRLLKRIATTVLLKRGLRLLLLTITVLLLAALTRTLSLPLLLAGLFLFVGSLGAIAPNAAGMALSDQATRAGSASALMGSLQFFIGTLAGVAVGILEPGGALSMLGVMSVCAVAAFGLCHTGTNYWTGSQESS